MRFLGHRPQLCNSPHGPLSDTSAPPTTVQTLSGPRGSLRAGPASFPHPQMAIYGWPLPGAALSKTQTLTRVRDFPSVWRDSGQGAGPRFRSTSWAPEPGGRPGVRVFASLVLLESLTAGGAGWGAQAGRPGSGLFQHSGCWGEQGTSSCHRLLQGMGSQTRRVDPVGGSPTG